MFGSDTRPTHQFLEDRIVFIGVPIDDRVAVDVANALARLKKKEAAPITLCINSPGGTVLACEKIIRSLAALDVEIRTCCLGLAAGGAAHIFLAGHQRFARPEAKIQFTPFQGGSLEDRPGIEPVRQSFVSRAGITLGVSDATIEQWMADEVCLSGTELIQQGIARQIA